MDEPHDSHNRRAQRARQRAIATVGVVAGALLVVWGLFAARLPPGGTNAYLITPILLGPTLVFLSLVWYSSIREQTPGSRYDPSARSNVDEVREGPPVP